MFVTLIGGLALLVLTSWLLSYLIFTSKLKIFPAFKGWPLLGVVWEFRRPEDSVARGLQYFRSCGTSFVIYFGWKPYLLICDPELTETVLSSNKLINKNSEYKILHAWFGDGLLTSTGNKWKSHRKILTPSFHYVILEEFLQVFDNASQVLVKQLHKEVGNDSFDVYKYITLCTLDIICETAMGTAINAQENPQHEFVQSVKDMCHVMWTRAFTLSRFTWFYRLTKWYRMELKAIRIMRQFSHSIIEKRRKVLEQNGGTPLDIDELGMKRKHSFLDVLLQANVNGRPLTDQEIREEVDTFMFEGHDTTAVSLSFTVYLMSRHLDVQRKVYEEIQSIIGPDKKQPITMNHMQNLKYTDMVIKESLRLYPSVVAFGRHISHDVPYKNGIIPKGLEVLLLTYFLHRNPAVFPDPEKFDPERFSSENCTKRHPYAYIPFSAGPRNCIGQKFAMLELKSTLTKILRCYEILPAIPQHDVIPISKVTIQSFNGIRIRLKER